MVLPGVSSFGVKGLKELTDPEPPSRHASRRMLPARRFDFPNTAAAASALSGSDGHQGSVLSQDAGRSRPMPRLAPVMTADLSFNAFSSSLHVIVGPLALACRPRPEWLG